MNRRSDSEATYFRQVTIVTKA